MNIIGFISRNFTTIGLLVGVVMVIRAIKGTFSSSPNAGLSKNEKLNEDKNQQTLVDAEVKMIVGEIYSATVTEGFANSLKLLLPPFSRMKNQADFNAVYNEFGKRQYSLFWGNVGDPVMSSKHDMMTIITNELSASEMMELRRANPQISF